ncbi:MAG: aldo/keto reductase, partial [Varibaculum cambriense]|nr:aldo/keto reductase [Varibaculum cambriense]
MEKRRLGRTGLMVSSLGLGTLTWGRDTDLEQASQQLRMFLDAGGNLLDTAATYGEGESEKLIGTLLDEEFSREDLVICSTAGVRAGDPPSVDASRANLLRGLDQTLQRLGTSYID